MPSLWPLLLCALAGCGGQGADVRDTAPAQRPATDHTPGAGDLAPGDAEESASAEPIEVRLVDGEQYQQVVAEHQGKVVAVDFWATWCRPCKEAFPHMVELSRQFPQEQAVFVSLSVDEVSDQQKVEKFLQDAGARRMQNLMSKLGGAPSMEPFDLSAGVPCYKLYDRQGQLRYQFAAEGDPDKNLLSMDEFDIKLREVLAE